MKRGFTIVEVLHVTTIVLIVALFSALPAIYSCTSTGRGVWNRHMYNVQKTDDATRYATLKEVEDTCRAMQASYSADKESYAVYTATGQHEFAAQAAIRANRTASTYNEYVRKNSFVWRGAVPPDIDFNLPPVGVK